MSKNFRHPNVVHFQSNKIVLRQKSFCRRCRRKKSRAFQFSLPKNFNGFRVDSERIANGRECQWSPMDFVGGFLFDPNLHMVGDVLRRLDVVQIRLLDAAQTL